MDRPNKIPKDVLPYIEYLENQLKSPFADSYISIKRIVDQGNKQLSDIKIDIFNPDDEKKSAMIGKYLDKLESYAKQMEYFKSKMTPEEERKTSLIVKEDGVEEYLKTVKVK